MSTKQVSQVSQSIEPNFSEYFKDTVNQFMFAVQMDTNSPSDFHEGDKVLVLRSIDMYIPILNTIPIGSIGTIVNIMYRYKGQPAEHYEYWVYSNGKKERYELNNIFNYDRAVQVLHNLISNKI